MQNYDDPIKASTPTENRRRTLTDTFIPACLDDAGLSAAEFRVFCRVARWAECFQAVDTISKGCHLHPKTVRKALESLVNRGLLLRQQRYGTTSIYRVAPVDPFQTNIDHPCQTETPMVPALKVPTQVGKGGEPLSSFLKTGFEKPTWEQVDEFSNTEELDGNFVAAFFDQHERADWMIPNKLTRKLEPVRNWQKALIAFCTKLEADRDGEPF